MPVVALNTNVVDLFVETPPGDADLLESLEAAASSPAWFSDDQAAVWWMKALATGQWRGVFYTLSPVAYDELLAMPEGKRIRAERLLEWAVELRENQPRELKSIAEDAGFLRRLRAEGLRRGDGLHVADAVAMGASHFMTLDRGILKRSSVVQRIGGVVVTTPASFVDRVFGSHLWCSDRAFS